MADKITTFGAKLYKTSISLATEVANLTSFGAVDFSRGDVDTSTHADNWKTFLPGQWDGGDIPVKIEFDPQDTVHIALWTTDTGSGTPTTALDTWIATVPSNALGTKKMAIQFTGYVKSFNIEEHTPEGVMVLNVTFKVSGLPVFTPDEATTPA